MGTTGASRVLNHYRDIFKPVYEETCGDRGTYSNIGDQFGSYMHINDIRMGQMLAMGPGRATAIFRDFVTRGGGCHDDSPAGQARQIARDIKAANDPFERLLSMFRFVDLYITRVDHLEDLGTQTNGAGRIQANISMQRLATLTENVLEHFWTELERQFMSGRKLATISSVWNKLQNRFHPAEREIAYAQATFVETIHHLIKAFILGLNAQQASTDETENRGLKFFISAYRIFKNPFHWINWAYQNRSFNNPHLKITVDGPRPEIQAVNHQGVRRVIDLIVTNASLLAEENFPVEISFSWDDDKKQILISSKHLDLMPQFIWKRISLLVGDWDRTIIKLEDGTNMISIPVAIEDMQRPSGTGGTNGSTSSTPFGGGSETSSTEETATAAPVITGMSPASEVDSQAVGTFHISGARFMSPMTNSIYYGNQPMTGLQGPAMGFLPPSFPAMPLTFRP